MLSCACSYLARCTWLAHIARQCCEPAGLIKCVRAVLTSCKLHVMLRPRGGDFLYTSDEVAVMLADIEACASLGADGVVFGCLMADGTVHEKQTAMLLAAARRQGLDATFHRAFDMASDCFLALEALAALGVSRVLTSGGCATAVEGAANLAALVTQSAGRVAIMAGAGIGSAALPPERLPTFLAATGVKEVHGSAKVNVQSGMKHRSALRMCAEQPPCDWQWVGTEQSLVTRIVASTSQWPTS